MLTIASVARSCSSNIAASNRRNISLSSGSVGNILNRLFSVPKGFRNFSPKNSTESKFDTSKQQLRARSTNKSGGGGGKKKPDDESQNNMWGTLLAIGLIPVLYALNGDKTTGGKEISYFEFHNQLIPSGQVERIVVQNKTTAKVELRKITIGTEASQTSAGVLDNAFQDDHFSKSNSAIVMEDGVGGSTKQPKPLIPAEPTKWFGGALTVQPETTAYYIKIGSVDSFEKKLEDSRRAYHINRKDFIPVTYEDTPDYYDVIYKGAMLALILGSVVFTASLMKKGPAGMGGMGGMMNAGKNKAKKITKEMVDVTFKDVAGCEEAKKEIMEFVEFLKDHKKFTDLGAKIPKGALISGPPGTGKTLLAKAVAGEADVPFFSISGSDFVEMFVGVGPSRVRDLFKEARADAPCIIFIDEIDAVGRKRGSSKAGGIDERENTLNQLLVEMDGFDSTSGIVMLAGTNRADVLDPALLRPGRFDRKILVDNPDIKGRKSIFDIYLGKLATGDADKSQLAARLAALTPGFAGADIANICNEAAIIAARSGEKAVKMSHFEQATDRIIGGLETHKIMSPEERRVVAYHEAGHAVAGWNLEHTDPLLKVTIVPRGNGALGFAQYLPKEVALRNREQLLDMICMALAGRASEQINFGKITTGASDDLKRVTSIVYQMVQVFGMNEKVGQVSFPRDQEAGFQERPYGNALSELMDSEAKLLIDEAYQRTIDLIADKKDQVVAVAEMLLEKETISHIDIHNAIGKRPYSTEAEYEQFVGLTWDKAVEGVQESVKEGSNNNDENSGDGEGTEEIAVGNSVPI